MDKSTFTGEAKSITDIPAGCQMSFYTDTKGGADSNLDKSHAATDAWYGGEAHYDYAKGAYKETHDGKKLTASQKTLAEAFTRMLWKANRTVAFGIKGKHVAAWYC